MRSDVDNWNSISVQEAATLFSGASFKWCIAGGWALDLHLGRQTRLHGDIDILLFREEQQAAYRHLSKDWLLYRAEQGKLTLWEVGDYLNTTGDVWASKDQHSPWAFQIMLVDVEQQWWVYRRTPSIRMPVHELYATTATGIPYLKPEIQLLYKGGSSSIREKDTQDLIAVLPSLLPQAREWLRVALTTQFPEGHLWIDYIENN